MKRALLVFAVVSSLAACAAQKEAASPQAHGAKESAEAQPAAAGYAQPGYAQPGYAPPPPSVAGPSAAPAPMIPGLPQAGALARSSRAFVEASVMLEQAASDCKAACRALDAMDRSAGELCEIEADRTCKDVEGRVRLARDRVRGACGTCPDGPSLDRDAPVPSRR